MVVVVCCWMGVMDGHGGSGEGCKEGGEVDWGWHWEDKVMVEGGVKVSGSEGYMMN